MLLFYPLSLFFSLLYLHIYLIFLTRYTTGNLIQNVPPPVTKGGLDLYRSACPSRFSDQSEGGEGEEADPAG